MARFILLKLRDSGLNYIYAVTELELKEMDYVIIEHDRGLDYAQVVSFEEEQSLKTKELLKKIIRKCESEDLRQIEDNRIKAKEALKICEEKINEHKLDMKLLSAEYSFDRHKILFYFTSEGRVDFRALVKDLAKIFKTRIELRQVGVRDAAKLFGGFGPCGRTLCCATFLKDFEPVSIKMAKEQGLALNPQKLSGLCARLMCCLSYEYDIYKILGKGLPKLGEKINTPQGKAKVIGINVFRRTATLELEGGAQIEMSFK